jgi:hypothetical protein
MFLVQQLILQYSVAKLVVLLHPLLLQLYDIDDALFKEYNSRVGSELEMAKDQYRKAVEEADVEAQLASQQNIVKLAVEQETLSRI